MKKVEGGGSLLKKIVNSFQNKFRIILFLIACPAKQNNNG
jgi:hypothetical protein